MANRRLKESILVGEQKSTAGSSGQPAKFTMAKRIKGAMTCRRLLTLLIVRDVGGKPGGPTIQRFTSSESGVNVGTAGDPKRTNIYKA